MERKKRAVIRHQDVVDWLVKNPKSDTLEMAQYFGTTRRTAQIHLKRIRQKVGE